MNVPTMLKDSGLFTQVESEYISFETGTITFVSRSRGIVVNVDADSDRMTGYVYVDVGRDTYYCAGKYTAHEIQYYMLPVLKCSKAFDHYLRGDEHYFTESIEYVK